MRYNQLQGSDGQEEGRILCRPGDVISPLYSSVCLYRSLPANFENIHVLAKKGGKKKQGGLKSK